MPTYPYYPACQETYVVVPRYPVLWFQILLRQHDILLKRQFTDIKDTITTLHRCRRHRDAKDGVCTSSTSLQSTGSGDFGMDNYSVRSASSVTALDEGGTDEDDDVIDLMFRPRTSSMKTTRDLAALARRRGSKELIWKTIATTTKYYFKYS